MSVPHTDRSASEWRVVQRWPGGDELALVVGDEQEARGRQAVLDANTSHPSGYQRRVEVVRIESRKVGPWTDVDACEHNGNWDQNENGTFICEACGRPVDGAASDQEQRP